MKPDFVHVFVGGRIVAEGGPELAEELEHEGYEKFRQGRERASMTFDVARIRKDFPILDRQVRGGQPLIYLDSANTSQKPRQVIDAMAEFYERHNANIHRASHQLGEEATEAYEGARIKVGEFIGARDETEVVFTKNVSEAINLVAYSMSNATGSRARPVPPRPRRRDRHHRDGAPLQHRPVAAALPADRRHAALVRRDRRTAGWTPPASAT